MFDMDKIINMMNIIMQKSWLRIHAYKYVGGLSFKYYCNSQYQL
jgi:hypothetical protein